MSSDGSGNAPPITTTQPLTGGETNSRPASGSPDASANAHGRSPSSPIERATSSGLRERTASQVRGRLNTDGASRRRTLRAKVISSSRVWRARRRPSA